MFSKSSHRNSINHYSKLQLDRVKYLNDMIEARQSKAKSVAFRHEILEKQKMKQYQSDFDRIRAHLEDSAIPFKTRETLKSRTEHLRALGAKAVESIV